MSTGRKPSSPSESLPVEPTGLVGQEAGSVGHRQPPRQAWDSFDGMSNFWSVAVLPNAASSGLPVRASANVRRTSPVCRVGDWLETLTVNSSTSPSRKNRGGLGSTIKSLAVTTFVLQEPAAQAGVMGEAEKLPLRQRLRHGEFQFDAAFLIGDQVREEEGRFVQVLAGGDFAQSAQPP